MRLYTPDDLGADPEYCEGVSGQRCAHCQQVVKASDLVHVPGVGHICSACDEELLDQALAAVDDRCGDDPSVTRTPLKESV